MKTLHEPSTDGSLHAPGGVGAPRDEHGSLCCRRARSKRGSRAAHLSRSLPAWNFAATWQDRVSPPGWLLVADDAIGGSYAIDGGALGSTPGNVNYVAPDFLEWEDLERGFTGFLFYETMRWAGWREEIAELNGDKVLGIYPPL